MALDLLNRYVLDQRSNIDAWLRSVTNLHPSHCVSELRDKRIVDARLNIKSIGANAGLTGVSIFGGDRPLCRLVHIRVIKDDEGRIAAKFEPEFLHRVGRLAIEQFSNLGRAGEGELADQRITRHLRADAARVAGRNDAQQAFRQARFLGQHREG